MEMLDIPPGPVVGKILDHLLERVLDVPEDNTPAKLKVFAREYYRNLLKSDNAIANDKGQDA